MRNRLLDLLFFALKLLVAVGVARLIAFSVFFDGRKSFTVTEPTLFAALAIGMIFAFVARGPGE